MVDQVFSPITFSEARVLLLLLERLSPREAAEALGVSLGTVRTHIKRLQAKSETHSLATLVLWGRDDCLLSSDGVWSQRLHEYLAARRVT